MAKLNRKYTILKNWKKDNAILIGKLFPNIKREEIDKQLDKFINENIKKEEIILNNTYQEKELFSDTLDVTEFYYKNKPSTGGNGVLFDATQFNPALKMLEAFGVRRTAYKKQMKTYPENSYEFNSFNLKQNNEKVKMNAWYGISGAPTSLFFNLECATAITAKGKQLISVATCAFESFLGDNVPFLDMNDCLIFIKNILKENTTRKFSDDILDNDISIYKVYDRLINNFDTDSCTDFDKDVILRLLKNCSKEDLNRIYYKNNIFEFLRNKKIKKLYRKMIVNTEIYTNPDEDKTPPELKMMLEEMWDYLKEFVLYNHEYVDRVFRVKNKMRRVALVIDTDSNNWSV